jgi:hypothetical protein
MRFVITLLLAAFSLVALARAQEDEIVANLAGGRVLIHVTRDAIVFGVIDHPVEAKAVPPRVAAIGPSHVGVLFGASEWQVPAQPRPIRLDREIGDLRSANAQTYQPPGSGDPDLELIGVGFLEKLRPLVSQLHHKFDLKPNEPILEIVLIGYAPQMYGPEVWLIDYGAEQESVGSRAEYWQTHVLRPRFTQLYPPEKHQAKTLLEVRFPSDLQATPLLGLIQQNDPGLAQLRGSDPRFAKLIEELEHGQANKAATQDSVDFLRAALPVLAGGARFSEGKMEEAGGFEWIVPPEEPVERQRAQEQKGQDKDRPADAPSLVRKPKPQR